MAHALGGTATARGHNSRQTRRSEEWDFNWPPAGTKTWPQLAVYAQTCYSIRLTDLSESKTTIQ
jgi:hypothetical protein